MKCMTIRTECKQIFWVVLSCVRNWHKMMNIKGDYRPANWIATLIACLVQNAVSDILGKRLAWHGFVGPNV